MKRPEHVQANPWGGGVVSPRDRVRRRDVDGRVRDYHLPVEVVNRAKEIARRTRLSGNERADIAVELCENAALQLGDGALVHEVLDRMGEPRSAGLAIRLQRIRRKPLLIRMFRGWVKRLALTILALALVYGYMLVRFATSKSRITRNIAAEFNAKLPSVPEEQTGLFALRRAMSISKPVPAEWGKRWPYFLPKDAEWADVKTFVESSAGVLEWVRRAAAAPSFGYRLTDAYDPSLSSDPATRQEPPTAGQENPVMLDTLLPHLGALRWSVRLLAADSRVACEGSDWDRVAADVRAIIGLAAHAREVPILICDLVGIAALSVACDEVGRIVEDHPGKLSDAQWIEISESLRAFAGGPIPLRLDGERAYFEDWLQRSYTDDGKGDGRLSLDGVAQVWSQVNSGGAKSKPGPGAYLLGPLASRALGTRKEMLDQWSRLEGMVIREREVPRWKRGEPAYEAEMDRLNADTRTSIKFAQIFVFAPAWAKGSDAMDNGSLRREGALAVIAIERWRLAHGSYPERLEQLVPEYLASVPIDTFDGLPLKYKFRDGRPILYALGGDSDDDGGKVAEPGNSKTNSISATWRPPSTRWKCPDGDFVLWPPVVDPVEVPVP